MSRLRRRGTQGALFGAALGLLLVLLFIIPKLFLGTSETLALLFQMSLIYVVGFAFVGAAAENLWPLAKRSWVLAGLIGILLALPIIFVVGLIALETREDLISVTLITGVALGFPLGVGFRMMFLYD